MYACVYCSEDKSLSVLGQRSKKLQLLGTFQVKEPVNMTWGKNEFSGIIIRIGDDEDKLTEFATQANKHVLKRGAAGAGNDSALIARLVEFDQTTVGGTHLTGKRKSKESSRLALSKEQEKNFSPKKKKKGPKSGQIGTVTNVQRNQSPAVQKAAQKRTEELVQREMLQDESTCNTLLSQFMQPDKPDTCAETSASDCTGKRSVSELSEKTAPVRQQLQFNTEPASTSLTSTWAMCTRNTSPPTPPKDVVRFYRALMNTDVQNYIASFLEYYDDSYSTEHNEQTSYTDTASFTDMLNRPLQSTPEPSQTDTSQKSLTFIHPTHTTTDNQSMNTSIDKPIDISENYQPILAPTDNQLIHTPSNNQSMYSSFSQSMNSPTHIQPILLPTNDHSMQTNTNNESIHTNHQPMNTPSHNQYMYTAAYNQPTNTPSYNQPMYTPSQNQPMNTPSQSQPMNTPSHNQPTNNPSHNQSMNTTSHNQSMNTLSHSQPTNNPSHNQSMNTPSHNHSMNTHSHIASQ